MKVLQNIKTELVTSIDIETVRIAEKFEDLSPEWKSAWEYKNKQDGVVPSQEELSDLWERNAALYAEFSQVCAVSLTSMGKKGLVCKEFYGKDEKRLLEALSKSLDGMIAHNKEYRLIGHAAKYFDYPFLGKRFIINGLDIPIALDATDSKPWLQANLCSNELWKLGGTGSGSSLQALCTALNVPVSKVDLVGDEVGAAFYRGEYQRIGRYCSYDTIADYNVLRRFKKEIIFDFEDVTYITAYTDDMQIEEEATVPILQALFVFKRFSDEMKEELKVILKDATADEKAGVEKILIAHYVDKVDVMDMDKKEKETTNKIRIEEVKEFISSL